MEALASCQVSMQVSSSAFGKGRLSLPSHQGLRVTPSSLSSQSRPQPLSARTSRPSSSSSSAAVTAAAAGVAAAPVAVLPILKFDGAPAGEAELSLKTARPESAKGLVHRAVIQHMQNKRRGTASTLTRAEVRGGGRKPMKQKGSGRARQGSTRTPLKPGGGVVFGPKPCDWTIKMNKKERQLAVGTALQSAAVNMTIVEDISDEEFPIPKTRDFVAALDRWGVDFKNDSTLFVTGQLSKNVDLSSRNIEKLKVVTPMSLNVYDVLRADKLVITVSGLSYLNRRFGGEFDDEITEEEAEGVLRLISSLAELDAGEELEEGVEEAGEEADGAGSE